MRWFSNLKIGVKLIIGFISVAIIAGVVGVTGMLNLNTINGSYSEMSDNNLKASASIGNIAVGFQNFKVYLRDILVEVGSADRGKFVEEIAKYDSVLADNMVIFKKTLRTENMEAEFKNLEASIAGYKPIRDEVLSLALANKESQALRLLRTDGVPVTLAVQKSIDKLIELNAEYSMQAASDNSSSANTSVLIMGALVVIGMIIAIVLGLYISRIISKPVRDLVTVSERMASGDLNVEVRINSNDEIGALSASFSTMVDSINEVLSNINVSSEQVASGSRQVSDSSQALSQGTTEQASSIQQLTASMEEISAQTKQNAINANQANELSIIAAENATEGNNQMQEMLKAMEDINDSSANISKIIKVIDEIAFQTNILALNAAVEAARAGQHGKGFAVVAEEVRNLAARSANAAKETTDMIEGSIKKVDAGTKIATATADALNKIVEGVAKAGTLVASIANASNEQATGISQVNQAIMLVSEVTQTNSATSEECASASEELSSQADLLKEMVGKFNLKQNGKAPAYSGYASSDVLRHSHSQAAPAKPRVRIDLDDMDFGKY